MILCLHDQTAQRACTLALVPPCLEPAAADRAENTFWWDDPSSNILLPHPAHAPAPHSYQAVIAGILAGIELRVICSLGGHRV